MDVDHLTDAVYGGGGAKGGGLAAGPGGGANCRGKCGLAGARMRDCVEDE